MKKQSFFSRITGAHSKDDDLFDDAYDSEDLSHDDGVRHPKITTRGDEWDRHDLPTEEGGELAVDIYQTADSIVVKAFIAGVPPSSLDIALTREMITISGSRTEEREVEEDDYFQRELYWGMFSRTVLLPEEVDVDLAEASEKHGVLMVRLPKVDKRRQTKLKVKSK
jgi:HSP20 family protein